MNLLPKTLLFVCSGNTCRSPLAWAAWQASEDTPANYQAQSGGLWAQDGARAAKHSIEIARDWGVNLESHQAQTLTRARVLAADCIAVMTPEHADALRENFGFSGDIVLLGEFDVSQDVATARLDAALNTDVAREFSLARSKVPPQRAILDPFGGSREAYQSCAAQIQRAVRGLAHHLKTQTKS